MESPTNFKQRYANYVSLHSTASHTLPTARWQLLLNEEMITPFQRQVVPLCPEKKNELKIRSNNNNKKPETQVGRNWLVPGWNWLVASLARWDQPTHTRVTVTSLQIAIDTNTLPQHYSLLHKQTLTESGSRLKARGGAGKGGAGSIQGKINASKGVVQRPCHVQLLQACPGLLGVGSGSWGVGKDSRRAGRHERHALGDSKPVTVAAATMSCVYCVDIWQREGPLPHTRGLGAWV